MPSFAVTRFRAPLESAGSRPLLFWPVWESPGSVVIWAEAVEAEPVETRDLLRIQSRLSLHFLHLLRLERRLFARAQQRRGRGGRKAVRQIELERQRLGRELHTGVGQALAAIRLQLEVIATELPVAARERRACAAQHRHPDGGHDGAGSRPLPAPASTRVAKAYAGIGDPAVVGHQRSSAALRSVVFASSPYPGNRTWK